MAGKIATAALLGILILPQAGVSQQPDRMSTRARNQAGAAGNEAQVFQQTFETIRDYYIQSLGDSALWEKAIQGLIDGIEDPYATVFTPDELAEFREETTGDYAGIGVQISQLEESITITIVFKGTPAEDVGLLVGDRIVEVEGETTEGWTTTDTSDRIRGKPGTTVDVKIRREGVTTPLAFTISRSNVHVQAVHADVVHDSIGYILLDRVARGSADEIAAAFQEMSGTKGVILDLRRNLGGYLDESLWISDLLLAPGQRLASTRSRAIGRGGDRAEESWDDRRPAVLPNTPVVVLVDENTASAAEIVAGAWQDHDRALIIGSRTFGKGVVQTLLPLPAGRVIRLTTGEWYTPLGRSLHRPRDKQGHVVEQDIDTLPTVSTALGREIQAGGGVFPDLPIADDTLTLAERELFTAAAQAEVPLNLRVAEFALRIARRSQSDGSGPEVSRAEFDEFAAALIAEGLPTAALDATGVRDYLYWRTRIAAAERADALGLAMAYRMERDPVLTAAIELLEKASSQRELFSDAMVWSGGTGSTPSRTGARPGR
ncbi:MAG: S41 family peptidase [Gemmatimonadota bacterium]|nr:S41 family peptidase [Gemmatimonadota bacterium]